MGFMDKQKELEKKRQRCEVFSRIVGYYRPVNYWNDGKKQEYNDRVEFELK